MKRTEIHIEPGSELASVQKEMLPIHLPSPPKSPQVSMLPIAPIDVAESVGQIKEMSEGRAMDFKLMVKLPDGSQYYLEGSMDK